MGFFDGLLGGQNTATPETRLEGQQVGAPIYDPQTMDLAQAYGVNPALVKAAQDERRQNMMANLGTTLIAAGQGGPVGQRGQILSKMDLTGGQPMTTSLLNSSQMQLYAEKIKQAQEARQQQTEMNKFLQTAAGGGGDAAAGGTSKDLGLTPEQAKVLMALPAAQRAEALKQAIAAKMKGKDWSEPYKAKDGKYYQRKSDGEVKPVNGSQNNIAIDLGEKGASKLDVSEIEAAQKQAVVGRDIRGALDILHTQLMNGADTGQITASSLPLRSMLASAGLMSKEAADKASNEQVFQAASQYIVPRMRPQGSGSTSNMEEGMYAQAAPNLAKLPEGNLLNTAMLRQQHDYAERYAREMKDYYRKNKSLDGWDPSTVPGPLRTVEDGDFEKAGVKVGEMFYSPEAAKRGINYGFVIRRK